MLIVDYQSKSYYHFLNDMPQIADHKRRFLITFNGANESDLIAAEADLFEHTKNNVQHATSIIDKATEQEVAELFKVARDKRQILMFENADPLFDKKTAVKNSHERDNAFNINSLFKNIAQHNGIVVLSTDKKQTLNASISTKMDVLVRFK
jgi:hypothetical protein